MFPLVNSEKFEKPLPEKMCLEIYKLDLGHIMKIC